MPFYLGENQYKVYLNGQKYKFTNHQIKIDIPNNVLISSDKFYLKDKNGVYLTALQEMSLYTSNDEQLIGANNEILLVEGE